MSVHSADMYWNIGYGLELSVHELSVHELSVHVEVGVAEEEEKEEVEEFCALTQ